MGEIEKQAATSRCSSNKLEWEKIQKHIDFLTKPGVAGNKVEVALENSRSPIVGVAREPYWTDKDISGRNYPFYVARGVACIEVGGENRYIDLLDIRILKMRCPECDHVFQGNGWDGIDGHWRAKHEDIMPYEEAWQMIRSGTYK